MASDVSFVEYICDRLRDVGEPSSRKMFGEYAIYLDGRVVALVCDDRLFVKQTAGGRALLDDPVEAPPYPGAKPHFLIEDRLDDREWLGALVRVTADELLPPAPRRARRRRPE